MKKVKITKYNLASIDSLIRWYKKHGLIQNNRTMYDGAKISEADDSTLNNNLSPYEYFNYCPLLDSSLKRGEALVLTEDELKYRIKKRKLLDQY